MRRCPSCTAPIDDATASSPDHLFNPSGVGPPGTRADSFKHETAPAPRVLPRRVDPSATLERKAATRLLETLRSSSAGRSLDLVFKHLGS